MNIYIPVVQVLLLVALAAPVAFADADLWTVDPAHSLVTFTLKSMKVRSIPCQFKTVTGTAHYDGKDLSNASIEAHIDPASLDSHQAKLDQKLLGQDFLDVSQYPDLVFKSIKFQPDEHGGFTVQGKLQMHGIEQKVSFEGAPVRTVSFNEIGERSRIKTTATGQLNRTDFAMYGGRLDRGGLKLSDRVQIELNIELFRS